MANSVGCIAWAIAAVACSSESSVELSVLRGNGDGTFVPGVHYGTGSGTSMSLAAADFNDDGRLDLAVTGNDANDCYLRVLRGNGDGTFASEDIRGGSCGSVLASDFDGDGIPDLVVVSTQGTTSFFRGLGDGRFAEPIDSGSVVSPEGDDQQMAAVGDFNLDGKPDIAFADFYSAWVLLGDGAGEFASSALNVDGVGMSSVAIADVNGDGNPDLVLGGSFGPTTPGTAVGIQLGMGNGAFVAGTNVGNAPPAFVLASETFQRNAQPAIVYKDPGGAIFVLNNDSAGTFATQNAYGGDGGGNSALVLVDVNGDGVPDIVSPNNEAHVEVFLASASGELQSTLSSPDASLQLGEMTSPLAVVAGDWDNDGVPDLAIARGFF